nr:uridine diphosphate glucose pyrophosphatase isoform X3 [Dromaius novaehollandiae]
MEAIEELVIQPCASSLYLRPFRLCYRQNGTKKVWDCMRTHDSVSILIFNTSRQCFVVVKQFRPAVYMCEVERHCPQVFQNQDKENCHLEDPLPAVVGVTYELCAGIVDKPDLSLEEVAREEILEECGYCVPATDLRKITSYRGKKLNLLWCCTSGSSLLLLKRKDVWRVNSCDFHSCSYFRSERS